MNKLAIILLGIGLVPVTAFADTQGKRGSDGGSDIVLVAVTCDELSDEARSRQAACIGTTAHTSLATPEPVARRASAEPSNSGRRIVRMPWLIGVYQ